MSYFNGFGVINYDYTIKQDDQPVIENIVDILQRIKMRISEEDLDTMSERYLVPDGMKPEQVSHRLYEDAFLHWTILYINDINDVNGDWPVSDVILNKFISRKYGLGNEDSTHHYEELDSGVKMDEQFILDTYGNDKARLVTNSIYEHELNQMKRHIKVIKPDYIVSFVDAFKGALID